MRSKILALILSLFVCTPAAIVAGGNIEWIETQHSFGDILESDGKVAHRFLMVNTGDDDVVIKHVRPSCGCSATDYPRRPISPGDTAAITATFNPAGRPGDFDTFFNSETEFEMVATNCRTGLAEYLSERHDRQRALDVVRASSSLPYVSKIVFVDGKPMLDGGIVDSIPVEHAMQKGYSHNVVVLTRNKGYRNDSRDIKIPRFIYRDYPRLRVALSHRIEVYNRQLDMIDRLEQEGRITCIRPQRPMEVDRIEKDTKKLEALYEEGFALGEAFCKDYGGAK